MALLQRVIALAILLQITGAVIEFDKSKLFDETDLAVQVVNINFCDVGCRIYVSVPESSIDVAKQIMVHDYAHDDKSLYDISKLKNVDQKGYFDVEAGNAQVNLMNTNPHFATAPMAVWVVRKDSDNMGATNVYDAAGLQTAPDYLQLVTVMSAVPFHLQTTTDGQMTLIATLTGYDAITNGNDVCTLVLEQMNPNASSDVQVSVSSPLITIFYNDVEYFLTKTALQADVGKGKLDFSGPSYTYRSSLYDASTSCSYRNFDWFYDVALTSALSTDDQHPVTIKDNANNQEYKWSSTTQDADRDISLQQTNSLDISWTRNDANVDQSFLIRLTPSNPQAIPETTQKTRRTTSEKPTSTTPTHPKDVSTTTTRRPSTSPTTQPTTTSSAAGYGSTVAALTIASVFLL